MTEGDFVLLAMLIFILFGPFVSMVYYEEGRIVEFLELQLRFLTLLGLIFIGRGILVGSQNSILFGLTCLFLGIVSANSSYAPNPVLAFFARLMGSPAYGFSGFSWNEILGIIVETIVSVIVGIFLLLGALLNFVLSFLI